MDGSLQEAVHFGTPSVESAGKIHKIGFGIKTALLYYHAREPFFQMNFDRTLSVHNLGWLITQHSANDLHHSVVR